MEDEATLLRQVFGDSSEDDNYDEDSDSPETGIFPVVDDGTNSAAAGNPRWERVKEVRGLWILRDFLSPDQQLRLLAAIQSEGWFVEDSHNQAMRFGDLPAWINEICVLIREVVLSGDSLSEHDSAPPDEHLFPILSPELLRREPLFDQLIANLYHPGQGICAHVDLMRFDDGIAIISLESSCVMHFTPASSSVQQEEERTEPRVPVYLTPGSLAIMSGEARYNWKHEINRKPGFQVWDGHEIDQQRRISLTLRKLAHAE